jgi:dTDP-4-dehydrorhamnose reductase
VKVLLIGATGMLGRAFREELTRHEIAFIAAGRDRVDLLTGGSGQVGASIDSLLAQHACDTLINCAAWTDVDGAETQEAAATRVNGDAVREMAQSCARRNALFVNFGTDYVFSGVASAPYTVAQRREPLNAYGRSKAAGETALEQLDTKHWLHIRTSWLYAPWGKNFVRTIRSLLLNKPSIKVVNDQRGRPTSSEHLARTTLGMLTKGSRGTQHATDGGECTWFEFAQEIGRLAGAKGEVLPCTSDEFPRPAKRPAYSVLDISHTEKLVGPMTPWRTALADVMGRLEV